MTHKEALADIIAAWDQPHYGDMEAARYSLFEPIEAARRLLTDKPSEGDFALSYRRTDRGYTGVFALRGDEKWRQCRDIHGGLLWRENPYQAEADAAHKLVAALRKEI